MIIRVAHKSKYTVAANRTVRDPRISFRATGLLVYLLSLPDDARVNFRVLADAKKEGEKAVLAAMNELRDAGYLTRTRVKGIRGRWLTEITVSEIPGSAGSPFPPPAPPLLGKPPLLYEVPIHAGEHRCAGCGDPTAQQQRGEWRCIDCQEAG